MKFLFILLFVVSCCQDILLADNVDSSSDELFIEEDSGEESSIETKLQDYANELREVLDENSEN